jgi:hypothetical protein
MQLKSRLAGTSNSGAILRHFMIYKVLGDRPSGPTQSNAAAGGTA